MLRVLPYLIILMIALGLSKLVSLIPNEDENVLEVANIHAEENQSTEMQNSIQNSEIQSIQEQNKKPQNDQLVEYGTEVSQTQYAFSKMEIGILQSLRKRRLELQEHEKTLAIKENALIAVKNEIDNRINYLEKLQKKLETLMSQRAKTDEAKVSRLVKVYENMKPKDAARIFEELGPEILGEIANSMKEAKLAQIVAEMKPDKAREIALAMSSGNNNIFG